jgi:hypothetical protein
LWSSYMYLVFFYKKNCSSWFWYMKYLLRQIFTVKTSTRSKICELMNFTSYQVLCIQVHPRLKKIQGCLHGLWMILCFIVCSLMHSSQHVLKVVPLVHYGNALYISTSCDMRHKLICHLSYIHSLYVVVNKTKYQTHIIEGNKGRPST